MKSRFGVATAVGFTIANSGCSSEDISGVARPVGRPLAQAIAHPLAEQSVKQACTDFRWIGESDPSAPCRPASEWTVRRLIDNTDVPSLSKYCTYEWSLGAQPNVAALPPGLDRDCFASVGQTVSDIDALVRPILIDAHHAQLEMPSAVAVPAGAPIEVAVVDTWATADNPGRSTHGFAMGGLIQDVACTPLSGVCPIVTAPFLALDRFGPRRLRDVAHGGTYGSQAQLAKAVHDAVSLGSAHRVLNISAGWDGRYNPSTAEPGKPSHAVRAVEAALRYAACQGALVIAAAGNATGGPEPGTGPIFPAAFEQFQAPACTNAVRPLVYSVGGVDGLDRAIANTRVHGRPVLAAPSFAVPSSNETSSGALTLLSPLTGTSVSAATVSGIAALVWHIDPSLSAHEVMQVIRNSAEPLAEPADYCLQPPCGSVRRVSVCRAMKAAGAQVSCADVRVPAAKGNNPDLIEVIDDIHALGDEAADGTLLDHPQDANTCSIETFSTTVTLASEQLCPSEILTADLLVPAIDPQPNSNPCGTACILLAEVLADVTNPDDLDTRLTLTLPIAEDLRTNTEIVPETLTLTIGFGIPVARFDLGSAVQSTGVPLREGLVPGTTYTVLLDTESELTAGVHFTAATIEWSSAPTFHTSYPVVTSR